MAKPLDFEKEKLIVNVIYHDENVLKAALLRLKETFGEIELISEPFSFGDYSSYYDTELGGEGIRQIFAFKECVDPTRAAEIKLLTNEIEAEFSRKINLDPGLINDGHLILMSAKPLGFRVALSGGIYADYTLFYARGKYNKLPWTYRDYQNEDVQNFLLRVRRSYVLWRRSRLG